MIETFKTLAGAAGHSSMWAPVAAAPAKRSDEPSAQPGASLENPRTSWDRIFETEPGYAGKSVTETSALQLAAVWRCVTIISGTVARVPFLPYRREERGKVLARDHYLWPLLSVQANPFMTAYRWKRLMQTWLCLWGNAYSLIEENGRGQVVNLWPLRADKMTPKFAFDSEGRILGVIYEYIVPGGGLARFRSWEILHLRGLETDGLKGMSPIRAARQSLGLAMAAEEYGARYFGQGQHIGGWVEHPGALSPKARKNIDDSMVDLYGGLHGAHKIAVLEEGMKYHEVGVPPEDMQFLQTRQFQAIDIARLFGVPPHMIAELSRATFSNIEHQGIDFSNSSMDDWFSNWEAESTCSLLSVRESQSIELSFLRRRLLRGDRESRYAAYAIGRQNTFLSVNDIREEEDLNPINEPWADDYLQPLNMVVAGEGDAPSEDPEVVDADVDPASAGPVPGTSPLKPKEKKRARYRAILVPAGE